MVVTTGKRFESRFFKSLKRLPGMAIRVHDNGGKPTDDVLLGDFMLYRPDGEVFAIECKSTSKTRLPFVSAGKSGDGLRDEQLAKLVEFDRTAKNLHSLVAIHYQWTDELVLVNMDAITAYRKGSGYKSISEEDAAQIGWRQAKEGREWRLRI